MVVYVSLKLSVEANGVAVLAVLVQWLCRYKPQEKGAGGEPFKCDTNRTIMISYLLEQELKSESI